MIVINLIKSIWNITCFIVGSIILFATGIILSIFSNLVLGICYGIKYMRSFIAKYKLKEPILDFIGYTGWAMILYILLIFLNIKINLIIYLIQVWILVLIFEIINFVFEYFLGGRL